MRENVRDGPGFICGFHCDGVCKRGYWAFGFARLAGVSFAGFEVADGGCIGGFAMGMGMASNSVTVFVEEDKADDIAC